MKNKIGFNNKAVIVVILLVLVFSYPESLMSLEVPQLKGRINDYADILSASQESSLEQMLENLEGKTSSQVVLLTIPSLQGEVLEVFSVRVATDWKLGQDKYDNGVLLLVAMKERKIRIEVGYGLEPILTDAKSDFIIRKLMVTRFKRKDYYGGINEGLAAITGIISKDFDITPEELAKFQKDSKRKKRGGHFPLGTIIFIIFIILAAFGGGGRGRGYRRGGGIFFGGGGFGGGGFSGGGFSGGGGSFGGGGSSGGW
jgi:uncharacterized protein